MKKYRNIIIAFLIGVLASFIVYTSMKISKKKQIRKHRIEMKMDMKKDTIHNDSIRNARMKMWKEKKKKAKE